VRSTLVPHVGVSRQKYEATSLDHGGSFSKPDQEFPWLAEFRFVESVVGVIEKRYE